MMGMDDVRSGQSRHQTWRKRVRRVPAPPADGAQHADPQAARLTVAVRALAEGNQLTLDLTRQRPLTFFDGSGPGGVVHTDVVEPYHSALRREILDAGAATGRSVRDGGVYACFEGPRFETRAEIRLARLAGADVAGMTGVPEVTLAAEAGLRYAAISLVVNPASGVGDSAGPITMDEIAEVLRATAGDVLAVLDELVHARATVPVPDPDESPA